MQLVDIHHVAIKTLDLKRTDWFYTEILGMKLAKRPPFEFPGSWYDINGTMVHVLAGDAAYDRHGQFRPGGAAVDHISINAVGYDAYREAFRANGLDWREFDIPSVGLWQLFVKDPNGVLIELTFSKATEPPESRGYDAARKYLPGKF